jgi:hypothetical protein
MFFVGEEDMVILSANKLNSFRLQPTTYTFEYLVVL